jgi:plastocyanin
MKDSLKVTLILALVTGLALPSAASTKKPLTPSHQTYAVLVGWENPQEGVGVNAYFPELVTIHVGDTVRWTQNSNEIHTVTFLAGDPQPDFLISGADPSISPLMFNPLAVDPYVPTGGQYDGSQYANSGLMGRESGQVREFSLTFTAEGTFEYLCLVHGSMMSGQVMVMGSGVTVPSPVQARAQGRVQVGQALTQVPGVVQAARMQIKDSEENDDGTVTHYVMVGYSEGQIDLMQFFPRRLEVSPGDTVVWELSPKNMAPHTVTFLNGQAEPDLAVVVPQPSGPPLLYLNPEVLFGSPSTPADLTRKGFYNSGVMDPVHGPMTYTLVIGEMAPGLLPYLCMLHDTSGMKATLVVFPEFRQKPCFPAWGWPCWKDVPSSSSDR